MGFDARASESVRWEDWAFDSRGRQLPQTTRPEVVHELLTLFAPVAGWTVLEIGTGSGYSTALLSDIVGPVGRVVTLDIDPQPVRRVRKLVRKRGMSNVAVEVGDGYGGELFDGIIAWASVRQGCPPAWGEQLRPGGIADVPVRAASISYAVRLRWVGGGWYEEARIDASFVPMTPVPFRPWETGWDTPPPEYDSC